MILKIRNPKTDAWVYFDRVRRAHVPRQGAYSFVLVDLAENKHHLKLRWERGKPGDTVHSPDFMFLEEDELIESMLSEKTGAKTEPNVPAKVARLVMREGPSIEVAWLGAAAFLLNDEGKTIERL